MVAELNRQVLDLLLAHRGLTQEQVATKSGLKQGYISQLKTGVRHPSTSSLEALAKALNCNVKLLQSEETVRSGEAGELHFRKRKTLPVSARREIEAELHFSYLAVKGLTTGLDFRPALPLPLRDVSAEGDASRAAAELRRLWRIPAGPISNVTGYLEAAGILVLTYAMHGKADAVTRRCEEDWHVTLTSVEVPADRDRLSKAHELGHLVLHSSAAGEEVEDEANEFAAEFLTPADEIEPELAGLTTGKLQRLLDLRLAWGVSVPFLVRRARDLGCISDRQYRSFHPTLNANNLLYQSVRDAAWRELPQLVPRLLRAYEVDRGYDDSEMADLTLKTSEEYEVFAERYRSPDHARLRVVR